MKEFPNWIYGTFEFSIFHTDFVFLCDSAKNYRSQFDLILPFVGRGPARKIYNKHALKDLNHEIELWKLM